MPDNSNDIPEFYGSIHNLVLGASVFTINLAEVSYVEVAPSHGAAAEDELLHDVTVTFSGCLQPAISLTVDLADDLVKARIDKFFIHYTEVHATYD